MIHITLWHGNKLFNSSIKWYMLWRGYTHKRSFFWSQLHALHHSWPHVNVICVCTLKQNKGNRQREIPPTPHMPESRFLSSAGAQEPDSSNNSLPLRLKHWQTQLILVNVYLSFVCIIHTYIYIYRHTHICIYLSLSPPLLIHILCLYTFINMICRASFAERK